MSKNGMNVKKQLIRDFITSLYFQKKVVPFLDTECTLDQYCVYLTIGYYIATMYIELDPLFYKKNILPIVTNKVAGNKIKMSHHNKLMDIISEHRVYVPRDQHPLKTGRIGILYHTSDFVTPILDNLNNLCKQLQMFRHAEIMNYASSQFWLDSEKTTSYSPSDITCEHSSVVESEGQMICSKCGVCVGLANFRAEYKDCNDTDTSQARAEVEFATSLTDCIKQTNPSLNSKMESNKRKLGEIEKDLNEMDSEVMKRFIELTQKIDKSINYDPIFFKKVQAKATQIYRNLDHHRKKCNNTRCIFKKIINSKNDSYHNMIHYCIGCDCDTNGIKHKLNLSSHNCDERIVGMYKALDKPLDRVSILCTPPVENIRNNQEPLTIPIKCSKVCSFEETDAADNPPKLVEVRDALRETSLQLYMNTMANGALKAIITKNEYSSIPIEFMVHCIEKTMTGASVTVSGKTSALMCAFVDDIQNVIKDLNHEKVWDPEDNMFA